MQRPREIRLDDLNPCDVWTPEQLHQLKVSTEPTSGGPQLDALGNLSCGYRGPHKPVQVGYSAFTYLHRDVEDTVHGQSRTTSTITEVAGFPAVRAANPEGSISPCGFYIGTAEGQHLDISLSTVWPNDKSVEETCEMARTAAEMAMETLHTLR